MTAAVELALSSAPSPASDDLPAAVVRDARSEGITLALAADGDSLAVRAAGGALTASWRNRLGSAKAGVLAYLKWEREIDPACVVQLRWRTGYVEDWIPGDPLPVGAGFWRYGDLDEWVPIPGTWAWTGE